MSAKSGEVHIPTQKEIWEAHDATFAGINAYLQIGGDRLLFFDGQHKIQVRELQTGSSISHFEMQDGMITVARLRSDGRWLALGNDRGAVQMLAVGEQATPQKVAVHSGPIALLVWSPSGELLLSAGSQEKVKLTETDSKKERFEIDAHANFIDAPFTDASFCHGEDFICISGFGRILVLDSKTGQCLVAWNLSDSVIRVFGSPDGTSFLASDQAGRMHRWSVPQVVDRAALEQFMAHNPWVLDGSVLKARHE